MVVISQNKPEIIQTRTEALRVRMISQLMDKNWKNKIVHLSPIHSIAFFNVPPNFLQQANNDSLLQKKVVLLTISLYMSNWEKAPSSSKSSIFIEKYETVGLPKNDFWASQLFASKNFPFL